MQLHTMVYISCIFTVPVVKFALLETKKTDIKYIFKKGHSSLSDTCWWITWTPVSMNASNSVDKLMINKETLAHTEHIGVYK